MALAAASIVEEADETETVLTPVIAAPAAVVAEVQAPAPSPSTDDATPAVVRKDLFELFNLSITELVALRNDVEKASQVVAVPVAAEQVIKQIVAVKRVNANEARTQAALAYCEGEAEVKKAEIVVELQRTVDKLRGDIEVMERSKNGIIYRRDIVISRMEKVRSLPALMPSR